MVDGKNLHLLITLRYRYCLQFLSANICLNHAITVEKAHLTIAFIRQFRYAPHISLSLDRQIV